MSYEFEIVGVGGSAVVLRDAHKDPNQVYKVYLTKYSLWSQEQETRTKLMTALQRADPENQQFYLPDAIISEEIRKCILSTKLVSEMQGSFMQSSFCRNKMKDENFEQFQLRPLHKILVLRIPYGIPYSEDRWTASEHRQAFLILTFLHSLRIAHKDVHLCNFVANPMDGSLRIIDFGESEFIKDPKDIQEDLDALKDIPIKK